MERIFNGSHRREGEGSEYFEWWYFHFVGPQFTANLVLHETDIFGLEDNPYVSFTLLINGKEPRYFKKKLSVGSINEGIPFLGTENGEFLEDAQKIKIDLDFDECSLNLVIDKNIAPVAINDGVLCEEENKKSMWLVQVPFGNFKGNLKLSDEHIDFEGISYQDHQWGDLRIQDFVSQWAWGHLSNKDLTVIFFHILTQNGKMIDRVIASSLKEVKTFTSLKTDCLDDFSKDFDFYKSAYELSVSLPDGMKVNLPVLPDQLMRSRILEDHGKFKATYLRWASQNKDLSGLIEYLKIQR